MVNKKTEPSAQPYPAHASLNVWGPALDPVRITELLGMAPDESFRRGDARAGGKDLWPHGYWEVDSSEKVSASNPVTHIEWLLQQLEPRAAALEELSKDQGLDVWISCFWPMATSNEVLELDAGVLLRLGTLGLPVKFDVYAPSDN